MISNIIFFVSILFLSLLPIPSISASLPNDDIVTVRQRIIELAIWPNPENISDTIQNALSYSRSLNSSCYWPDINYYDQRVLGWSAEKHMSRITTMLQAMIGKIQIGGIIKSIFLFKQRVNY
jgi:hypothetical protein